MTSGEHSLASKAHEMNESDPRLNVEAERVAAYTVYAHDSAKRAIFIAGYADGRCGNAPDAEHFGNFFRVYNDGFCAGHDARTEALMLANAIPKPPLMSLAALEDVDITCAMCGAVVDPQGKCSFCPVNCSVCDAPLDDAGLCVNDDCPVGLAQQADQ